MKALLVLAGVLWCATGALADEFNLSLNADSIRTEFARPFASRPLQWDIGWMHHTDNGDALHASLNVTGKLKEGGAPITGGVGLRLAYTNGDASNQTGYALALGGFAKYVIPNYDRLSVRGHVYYAPGVLSGNDMEEYQDYQVQLAYNVLREADAYVGLRYVSADYEEASSANYSTWFHVGMAFRF
jgi:hypothetical protein